MKGFTHTLSMICAAMLFMNALPLQTVQAQNTVISANIRSDEPKGAFNKITVKNVISDSGATIVRFVTKAPSIKADTILLNDDASVRGAFDVSGFDTSSVMNMNRMFGDCSALAELDVSGFDTGKVTDMSEMYYWCYGLNELDVSRFDTQNVTKMGGMFSKCSALTVLDVSGFNTAKVTSMESMFDTCSSLTALDVSGFKTGQVKKINRMFSDCNALTVLDLSIFDISKVTQMDKMLRLSNLDAVCCSKSDYASYVEKASLEPATIRLNAMREYKRLDLDGNGKTRINDCVLLCRILNEDGFLTTADIRDFLQYLSQKKSVSDILECEQKEILFWQ